MNVCRLRSFDPDHNHQGCWINHLFQQQAPKDPQSKNNVLVTAMLGNAEQKRLTKPCRYGTGRSDGRPRIDAIVNRDRFPGGESGSVKGEPPECGVRNARDPVRRPQGLLQYKAVEKDLGKPKVRGNVINVQVMQSNYGGAAEGASMGRRGIGKVNNVRLEPPHDCRQLVVIPEIDAEGVVAYRRLMKVESRVVMWQR